MDFGFKFSEDDRKYNGIIVVVDRYSKMVYLASVPESITAHGFARFFIDTLYRLYLLPNEPVSN